MNVKQLTLITLLALAGVPTLAAYNNWNDFLDGTDYYGQVAEVTASAKKGGFNSLTDALAQVKGQIISLQAFLVDSGQDSVDYQTARSELAELELLEQKIEADLQSAFNWATIVPSQKQVAVASGIAGATAAGVYFQDSIKKAAALYGAKASKLVKDHPYFASAAALGVAGSALANYYYNQETVEHDEENTIVPVDPLYQRFYDELMLSVTNPGKKVVIATTGSLSAVAVAGTLYVKGTPEAVSKLFSALKNFRGVSIHAYDHSSRIANAIFNATQIWPFKR